LFGLALLVFFEAKQLSFLHNKTINNNIPFNNEQIIINISVWIDIESLKNFTYKTFHTDFIRRKKNGLRNMEKHTLPCGGLKRESIHP